MTPVNEAEFPAISEYLNISTPLPPHADLIFVFGTRLPDPIPIAVDLYQRDVAPYIVITGGDNRQTGVNEARAHCDLLLKSGIPADCIIMEDRSANTLENVTFALPEIEKRLDLHLIQRMIVVAKWMHARRAVMTLKRHVPDGIRYHIQTYNPWGITLENWRDLPEGRGRVLKNWENMPKYLAKGDIAEIKRDGDAYV